MDRRTIDLDYDKLLRRIRTEIEYIAAKKPDAALYRQISAIAEDEEMLADILREAMAALCVELREYSFEGKVDSASCEISYGATTNAFSGSAAIRDSACNYLSAMVVGKWLSLTSPEDSERYSAQGAQWLDGLVTLLNTRTRPSRPTPAENYNN